ncbi:MAG: hypothetical protein QXD32_07000, partial [Nitrososphaerota archaeon]
MHIEGLEPLQTLTQILRALADTVAGLFIRLIGFAMSGPINLAIVLAPLAAVAAIILLLRRAKAAVMVEPVEEIREEVPHDVMDQYEVDETIRVVIKREDGTAKYYSIEPELDERLQRIVSQIEEAYIRKGVDPSSVLKKLDLVEEDLKKVTYHVIKNLKGSWKLEPLIRDEQLEDITITKPGPAYVIHRRYPDMGWMETNIVFTAEELDRQARILAERNGAELSIAKPSAEV